MKTQKPIYIISIISSVIIVSMICQSTAGITSFGGAAVGFDVETTFVWTCTQHNDSTYIGNKFNTTITKIEANGTHLNVEGSYGSYNHTSQVWTHYGDNELLLSINETTKVLETNPLNLYLIPYPVNLPLISEIINGTSIYSAPYYPTKYNYTCVILGEATINITCYVWVNMTMDWQYMGTSGWVAFTYNEFGIATKSEQYFGLGMKTTIYELDTERLVPFGSFFLPISFITIVIIAIGITKKKKLFFKREN